MFYDRPDGTWYVEITRPGIVTEHVGDFTSKVAAETWIRESAYFRAQLGGRRSSREN
jgi:hypothetical protein